MNDPSTGPLPCKKHLSGSNQRGTEGASESVGPAPRGPVAVLHIVDSLEFGGVQTILKTLFEFQKENSRTHLLALRSTDSQVRINHPNVVVYPNAGRFSIGPLNLILKMVREHRIEVLHCHLIRSQVFGYLIARMFGRAGISLIFHEHGTAVAIDDGNRLSRIAFNLFQAAAATRVDLHIAISRFVEKSLFEIVRGRLKASVVLYNPARRLVQDCDLTSSFRAHAREELGVPADAFVVGMAARILERKGWRDFLAATSLLAERYPVFFLLAGDGQEFPEMTSEICARNLGRQGRALGYLADLTSLYAALDCFVMASHWEPAGLSHLEAQYFSVPVVGSNVPGFDETVQPNVNCIMFRPGDPGDMAEKIATLITDSGVRRRIAEGGRMNAERYSIECYTRDLNALYREIVEVKGAGQT